MRRQPRRLDRLSGPVGQRVRRRRPDIVAAAAAHGVSGLRVFGSVARGEDRPDSDVDLLADLPPGMSLFGLGRVQADLETIVGPGSTWCPPRISNRTSAPVLSATW